MNNQNFSSKESSVEVQKNKDILLESLVILTKLHQCPCTPEVLVSGLPLVNNRLTPNLFVRAAQKANLSAKVEKRSLKKLANLLLPAVLLLKDDQVAILTEISGDQLTVILPEVGSVEKKVAWKSIESLYTGFVILVQPTYDFEKRVVKDSYVQQKPKSWFWGTVWYFKRYYWQVLIASLFVNIFVIATPLFVMNVYNRVVPNAAMATLWMLALGVGLVFIFDFIIRTLRAFFIDAAGKKIDLILASRLFEHILGTKLSAQSESTGVRAAHMRDFESVREFFTSSSLLTVVDLPFVFIFLLLIWFLGGYLVLIPLIGAVIVFIVTFLSIKPIEKAINQSFIGMLQKQAIVVEALNNIEVIKSTNYTGPLLERWERYIGQTAQANMTSRFCSMIVMNSNLLVNYMVTVAVVVFGVYMIDSHALSLGALIAVTMLASRTMNPFSQIATFWIRYHQTKFSLNALNKIMQEELDGEHQTKLLYRPGFEGSISLEKVHFRYSGQSIDFIDDFDLSIKAGEKVGIIGGMGSGKSTLQKLIMGLYSPTSGAIRIDGIDIRQIEPSNLRQHIGYVPQEPKVFFGTVRDNLSMRKPWASDDEILQCARLSGADNFIDQHPQGYAMPVGENGKGLSGGQLQTLTVGRALLGNPKILLFDELTSMMDSQTEMVVIEQMKDYLKDKTCLLVTHKTSLLQLVDRVIMLHQGKILLDGPRDEVLKKLTQNQPIRQSHA